MFQKSFLKVHLLSFKSIPSRGKHTPTLAQHSLCIVPSPPPEVLKSLSSNIFEPTRMSVFFHSLSKLILGLRFCSSHCFCAAPLAVLYLPIYSFFNLPHPLSSPAHPKVSSITDNHSLPTTASCPWGHKHPPISLSTSLREKSFWRWNLKLS